MLKLIIGKKGTGKTKQLIDAVNTAVKTDKGHLVFINNGDRHMFDLDYKVRLIDTQDFKILRYGTLYGMLCGIMAQDFDISNIFVDSVTKIVEEDFVNSQEALEEIAKVAEKYNVNITMTASIDAQTAPEFVKKYL